MNNSESAGTSKTCPYCAETVLIDAILCRYCRGDLVNIRVPKQYSMAVFELSWRWGGAITLFTIIWKFAVTYITDLPELPLSAYLYPGMVDAVLWMISTYLLATIYRKLQLSPKYEWVAILVIGALIANFSSRQLPFRFN